MIAISPLKAFGFALVAVALVASHAFVYNAGEARSEQRMEAQRALAEATLAEATKKALQTQFSLQAKIDNIVEVKNAQIASITRQRDSLAASVRNRPVARDTTPAEDSPTGTGSTGAGLARGDAEFLIGYAADAAKLAAALNQCRAAYDEVHRKLNDH